MSFYTHGATGSPGSYARANSDLSPQDRVPAWNRSVANSAPASKQSRTPAWHTNARSASENSYTPPVGGRIPAWRQAATQPTEKPFRAALISQAYKSYQLDALRPTPAFDGAAHMKAHSDYREANKANPAIVQEGLNNLGLLAGKGRIEIFLREAIRRPGAARIMLQATRENPVNGKTIFDAPKLFQFKAYKSDSTAVMKTLTSTQQFFYKPEVALQHQFLLDADPNAAAMMARALRDLPATEKTCFDDTTLLRSEKFWEKPIKNLETLLRPEYLHNPEAAAKFIASLDGAAPSASKLAHAPNAAADTIVSNMAATLPPAKPRLMGQWLFSDQPLPPLSTERAKLPELLRPDASPTADAGRPQKKQRMVGGFVVSDTESEKGEEAPHHDVAATLLSLWTPRVNQAEPLAAEESLFVTQSPLPDRTVLDHTVLDRTVREGRRGSEAGDSAFVQSPRELSPDTDQEMLPARLQPTKRKTMSGSDTAERIDSRSARRETEIREKSSRDATINQVLAIFPNDTVDGKPGPNSVVRNKLKAAKRQSIDAYSSGNAEALMVGVALRPSMNGKREFVKDLL